MATASAVTVSAGVEASTSGLVAILAGGLGTRLGHLTAARPKALVEVRDRPLLDLVLESVRRSLPASRVLVITGHLAPAVDRFLRASSWAGVETCFIPPTGTAAAVERAIRTGVLRGEGCTVTVNCDTLVDVDLALLLREHRRAGSGCTIALTRHPDVQDAGSIEVGTGGTVLSVDAGAMPPSGLRPKGRGRWRAASTGVVAWSSWVLPEFREGLPSVERDVVPRLVREGWVRALDCGHLPCIDCGTPERLSLGREWDEWATVAPRSLDRRPA